MEWGAKCSNDQAFRACAHARGRRVRGYVQNGAPCRHPIPFCDFAPKDAASSRSENLLMAGLEAAARKTGCFSSVSFITRRFGAKNDAAVADGCRFRTHT